MTGALPEPPELDPIALSGSDFGRTRRGFEPTEVRSMLGRAADALRVWAERDAKLAARITELSKQLEEAERFDEARVTEVLGAETVRIVAAARDAAAEMRDQAARESNELLERSRAEVERTASELGAAAEADRADAARLREEAERSAAELIADATARADRTLSESREEAERTTTEANEAAAKLTAEARARHDEMIEAAAKVLDERTEAAEAAASGIRATASEELESARALAGEELETARREAAEVLAEAEAEAAAIGEEARGQGREMVEEARELRRQMLRDIAERTRAARQKVEAAKAARSEVLRVIRGAGSEIERSVSILADHDFEMRRAADAAAAGVPDDVELLVRELEGRLNAVPEDAALEGVPTGDAALEDVLTDDAAAEASAEADEGDPGDPDGVDGDGAGEDGAPADGADGDASDSASLASVHDLFEKLRSQEASPDGAEPDDGVAVLSGSGNPQTGGRTGGSQSDDSPSGDPSVLTGAVASVGVSSVAAELMVARDSSGSTTTVDRVADLHGPGGEAGAVSATARTATATTEPATLTGEDAEQPVDRGPLDRQQLLDRRDELLEPAVKLLGRTLKRLLSDEQNDVLDQVRRAKRSRVEVSDLLGEQDPTEEFSDRLGDAYREAAAAGATLWYELSGDSTASDRTAPDATSPGGRAAMPVAEAAGDPMVIDSLRSQIGEILSIRRAQLRELLEAHAEAGADASELVDRLRSAYRDLRTASVDELAGDLATGGFAAGTAVVAVESRWRWIVDNGGLPCADAEDNALEGSVPCGAAFPTGDTRPPAHPGCRCIVVPAEFALGSS